MESELLQVVLQCRRKRKDALWSGVNSRPARYKGLQVLEAFDPHGLSCRSQGLIGNTNARVELHSLRNMIHLGLHLCILFVLLAQAVLCQQCIDFGRSVYLCCRLLSLRIERERGEFNYVTKGQCWDY